ncbi:hypothetical protein M3J09_004692 [Ascochyta lentis]
MLGNLAAAVKVSAGDWILLESGGCHRRDFLNGRATFAKWNRQDSTIGCFHLDITAARSTLAKYKIMEDELVVHIILARDTKWLDRINNETSRGLIDDRLISSRPDTSPGSIFKDRQERCPTIQVKVN